MADYIVKDTELTSVANAIRTAGGTSSLLTFPNGFTNAINNISGGGGGGGSSDFSTCTLTLVDENSYAIEVPIIDEFPMGGEAINSYVAASGSYTVVLYKGLAVASSIDQPIASVSGSAEKMGDYIVKITGDCTVKITGDCTISF